MKNLFYLFIIFIGFILYSSIKYEYFSNSEKDEINKLLLNSENKIIRIIKNIVKNNDKFPIIEGPPGPQGPRGYTGYDGISQPRLIYNKEYNENKIVSVQGKQSNSDKSCNVSFMIDKPNGIFDITDTSKWNKIKSENGFKLQSAKNLDQCLSYDDTKEVFLAKCDDKTVYSNWTQEDGKIKAENITDKINNQCLSIDSIQETKRQKCNIPKSITNTLTLDVCNDDNKQIWTM